MSEVKSGCTDNGVTLKILKFAFFIVPIIYCFLVIFVLFSSFANKGLQFPLWAYGSALVIFLFVLGLRRLIFGRISADEASSCNTHAGGLGIKFQTKYIVYLVICEMVAVVGFLTPFLISDPVVGVNSSYPFFLVSLVLIFQFTPDSTGK